MRRAYLLEPPRFDLSWLYRNGYDVRFVFTDKDEAKSYTDKPAELFSVIQAFATADFNPEEDYLVLTGNLVMLVIAGMALQDLYPEHSIKMLRYDNDQAKYIPIHYVRAFNGLSKA